MPNFANILVLGLSLGFNQPEMEVIPVDTIINWQFYMGKHLLFKSHQFEKRLHSAVLQKEVQYDSVRFKIFYDWKGGIEDRKIDLVYKGKVLASFTKRNDIHRPFPISKTEIESILQEYPKETLIIKYYDSVYTYGKVVGLIRLDSTDSK